MSPPAAASAERTDDGTTSNAGEYRRRDTVSIADNVVVSRQPLTATRLNNAAVPLIEALSTSEFRSPASIAAETGHDRETVDRLFERLATRDFLEWRPARDLQHRPPTSVVVTVRNDRENLVHCLDALAELNYPDYEIVVVDDGSTDGTRELVEDRAKDDSDIHLVRVGEPDDPIGIGAARNRGVDAAHHDVIAFTDADCRPRPPWLADLVPCLAAADLVGGRVRPAGKSAASVYEGVNSSLDMGGYAARVDPAGTTPYLPTANLVGRRAVFETVAFPERNIAEDVDVCWGALDAGYTVVYTPTGVVEHTYRDSPREFAARRGTYGASEALLASEHDREDSSVDVPVAVLLVLALAVTGVVGTGTVATGAVVFAGAVLGLTAGVRGWRGWRRARRLTPAVSLSDLVESWGRKRLSSAYALSQEVTRYYVLPIAVLGGISWVVGPSWLGPSIATALSVTVALPAIVEYRVHDPETSRTAYAGYYLADHLGYQLGVYRGALVHGTLAHLRPSARFRLVS
ncbi:MULTISPECIES: glycosyltransferase [Halolamina]|uniref:Mycofactocin system glycosyltransferase n=1 Tax=Halolamina pelagica TaxID=699431 RepID=A0A1I5T6M9_9EURY|nr:MULTISPECIES: glycosyltransferase [Halolamina]NHX37489.1 glycosyltransferase [Halolamina sp. R1-12]SFP78307.1 mycofactocin system glycosyltransferase [Halolamina pelagica]